MTLDQSKLETLVHYVCWACDDPTKLGKVKLNKVLWFSDVYALLRLGRTITGETYKKDKFGPVARHLGQAVKALESRGDLQVDDSEHFEYPTWDFVAQSEPDMSAISDDEATIVAEAIRFVCYENTATSISDKTHDRIWELAQRHETMPVHAVLAAELGEISQDDINWALTEGE